MAVGDGGFRQVALGFDKNEVNAYISDLRKKMKSMEEDMKANDKKTEEALKLAEEADDRIKAAVKEVEDKLRDVELELKAEQQRNEGLTFKLEKADKALEDERKKMSDMLISGKGVSSEAQKAYTEIIDKANADAKVITDKAQEEAKAIVAEAEERRAAADANTNKFLDALKSQIDNITAGYKSISESAAEMLGAEIAPLPVAEIAPAAPAPKPKKKAEPVKEEVIEEIVAPAIVEEEPAAVEETPAAEEAPAAEEKADEMPAIAEVPTAEKSDDIATFDDVWGGSEIAAQTIYNDEKKDAVPLVNPDAMDMFGKDLFGTGIIEEENDEEIVSEIKPLDPPRGTDVDDVEGFENDLIAQTMPSGSLGADVNEDLLKAVQEAEAAFAIQPMKDLSMDEEEEEEAPVANTEDDLMKALREAEEALNSLAPAAAEATIDEEPAAAASKSSSASDDPWADLQKQFEAMEQAGLGAMEEPAPAAQPEPQAEPAAPSADDSSIWNFGSSSDSEDDMSSDMFGGFGGF